MKDAPLLHAIELAAWQAVALPVGALRPGGARAVGRRLGDLLYLVLPERRRIAHRNLGLALPELAAAERRRIARESFRTLGAASCDLIANRRLGPVAFCRRLTLEHWPRLAEAEARGRGLIVISAHFGFWEVAALSIGLYRGTFHVVGRPLDNPHLQRRLAAWRTRYGNQLLPKRGAARGVMRVLRERGRAGIVIDQRVHRSEGIRVPFFGHPATATPLAAQMAQRFEAPIAPIFCYPEPGGRYRVVVREVLEPPIETAEVPAATERCLAVIEQEIRRAPGLWLWMHERWKEAG
ncbi:MAG: lysophospholipid acyltransferase family protein [Thermoanaerobaculia bacterium]